MTATMNAVECPKCGSTQMWDNRSTKTNPRAPDYKCKDRNCDGAIWPPKANARPQAAPAQQQKQPTNFGDLPGDPADVDFATLAARYRECVVYVVKEILPGLTKSDVGSDPQSVAAMAAVLFIARDKRNV